MLRKTKEQSDINCLQNNNTEESTSAKENLQKENNIDINKLAEEQKSKKLSSKDDGHMKGSSIMSANLGAVDDIGGPSKQLKTPTSNSIWDSDKISSQVDKKDNKEITREEKQSMQDIKKQKKQQRMDELVDSIQENKKGNSIDLFSSSEAPKEGDYKIPSNQMSIFDNNAFDNIPEKTKGEKIAEDSKKRKAQKDESWKQDKKALSSEDIKNKLFNNFFGE